MPCKVKRGPIVKSALGSVMGRTMRAYECETHGQKWSSSETNSKTCHVGYALECREPDTVSASSTCRRCGLNHARVRALYSKP